MNDEQEGGETPPSEPLTDIEVNCPVNCPNRRTLTQGVTLNFGGGRSFHADPFELLLLWVIMLPIGIMVRDAPKTSFDDSIKRVAVTSGLIYAIHKAPTRKIYELLAGTKL